MFSREFLPMSWHGTVLWKAEHSFTASRQSIYCIMRKRMWGVDGVDVKDFHFSLLRSDNDVRVK